MEKANDSSSADPTAIKRPHCVYENAQQIPFKHVEFIGSGAQGSVDSVERDGKLYARKQFVISSTPTSRELERVMQETAITTRVQHGHVIRLIETYRQKNKFAIIMEPVAEANLATYLADLDEIPLGEDDGRREQLAEWFYCLTNALGYLHDSGILHRDIKPQNILTLRNKVFLTDFGISDEFQEATISGSTMVIGTRTYRSPERDAGRRSGRREDIFSLGAVFLEMMTVYSGKRYLSALQNFLEGPYSQNIAKVEQWIRESLLPNIYSMSFLYPFWYGAMLSLCGLMLERNRVSRPYITHLQTLWTFRTSHGGCETSWLPIGRCSCGSHRVETVGAIHDSWIEALSNAISGNNILDLHSTFQKWAAIARYEHLEGQMTDALRRLSHGKEESNECEIACLVAQHLVTILEQRKVPDDAECFTMLSKLIIREASLGSHHTNQYVQLCTALSRYPCDTCRYKNFHLLDAQAKFSAALRTQCIKTFGQWYKEMTDNPSISKDNSTAFMRFINFKCKWFETWNSSTELIFIIEPMLQLLEMGSPPSSSCMTAAATLLRTVSGFRMAYANSGQYQWMLQTAAESISRIAKAKLALSEHQLSCIFQRRISCTPYFCTINRCDQAMREPNEGPNYGSYLAHILEIHVAPACSTSVSD